jgi:ubiquinone/menaquinone biosynthesis C-methylase UbiE
VKDNFSKQSAAYARYRPQYPKELFEFLFSVAPSKSLAWDAGTGNGQIAYGLSPQFESVYACDLSAEQLSRAYRAPNIHYHHQPAVKTSLRNGSVDLITIGQAIHWFPFPAFYEEVKRVAKKDAIIAAIGYHLCRISPEVDLLIHHFYEEVLLGCWDPERRHFDAFYRTIPFPFREIKTPLFTMSIQWHPEDLLGFLATWSAVQHFKKKYGYNPLNEIRHEVLMKWPSNEIKTARWPVFVRAGKIDG